MQRVNGFTLCTIKCISKFVTISFDNIDNINQLIHTENAETYF